MFPRQIEIYLSLTQTLIYLDSHLRKRFRQAAASAAKLATASTLPPPPPRCHHRGARHAATKLPLPPPSCCRCCLQRRASPRPFQPVPAGAHVDCCVLKGCNRADPSKWAVWSQHGHLVPSQYPGQVSLSCFGKRKPPFPQQNIAPCHPPNHTLLVMRSIFRTGEVGVIWPNHQVWAIILPPPFEPIDLKKMERRSLSLGLGL
jgi:hypothetical protein